MLILKIIFAAFIVLSLAWVTERISPRAAGVLSGFPLGALLVTFFVGLEQGPEFGSKAALSMVLGLTACLGFLTTYWLVSRRFSKNNSLVVMLLISLTSLVVFLLMAMALSQLTLSAELALLVSLTAAGLCILSYQKIPNIEISSRVKLSFNVVLMRAATAISILLLITYFAATFGPYWSGLFASFPITILPVLLVIHRTYSANHIWPIIKNYPVGMGGQVSFGLSCYTLYPVIGVKWGTLVGLGAASIYLAIVALCIAHVRSK